MITVDETGVDIDSETEILEALKASVRGDIDPALDLSADDPIGAVLMAVTPQIRSCQEALLEALKARDPNQAQGAQLFGLGAINNIAPYEASQTRIVAQLTLEAGAAVPAGSQAYVVGHPEITGTLQEDVIATGAGTYEGVFLLDEYGPITVSAGTFTEIKTAETGWTAITNADPGAPGRNAETTPEFRIRRKKSLGLMGRGGAGAIQANVLQVPGVIDCMVLENRTSIVNDLGIPPRSFEVLIYDGESADSDQVAQAILDKWVGGVTAYGTTSGEALETVNGTQVPISVAFSRVEDVQIYVDVVVSGEGEILSDITTAVVDGGNALAIGSDVLLKKTESYVYSVLGAETEATVQQKQSGGSFAQANIPISYREKAKFMAEWVTVS